MYRRLVTFMKDIITGYNRELRIGGGFLTDLYC